MPYYSHIEQYEVFEETKPQQNNNRGVAIRRALRWKVVEENKYTDYRRELFTINTPWAAECFCNGWNLCVDALLNEIDMPEIYPEEAS